MCAEFPYQSLENGSADQKLLSVPHVILGLCPDEWPTHQANRSSVCDLVGHFLDQEVGDVLEDHRLQHEDGAQRLCAFHQRPPT